MATPASMIQHEMAQHMDDAKQQVIDFLDGFTTETTPGAASKIADYRAHLRPGTTVYITFLPGSDFADTLAVTRRLKDEGFNPVPHLAARSIPSRRFLDESLARLTGETGVSQVLCIGGAVNRPLGEFSDTMQMLETGLFDRHGIERIGLAGHPEGSPDISDAAIRAALRWKNAFAARTDAALYLVTQFCFDSAPIIEWDRRLRAEGNRLPIYIGIPGVASLKALIGHAKACGVGPSMRFLTRQARNVARLLSLNTPDRQVLELARYRATDPGCGIAGVHMYPLGGLRKSARWSYAVLDGEFDLAADGRGFKVSVDLD
jgi:methylenetetrahydrofolate reductase (NADPH)